MNTLKTLTITVLLIAMPIVSFAQKVSNVDFDKIKSVTTDSTSEYYYPKLLAQFTSQDTLLSNKQYIYLYYGQVFSKDYNPYLHSDDETSFYDCYNKEDYKGAIPHGLKALQENPLNTNLLRRISNSYDAIGDSINYNKYLSKAAFLLGIVYGSGDGKSKETAFVVANVSDEYALAEAFSLDVTSQELIGDPPTDVLHVKPWRDTPGNKGVKEFYFNVSKPFATLNKQIK